MWSIERWFPLGAHVVKQTSPFTLHHSFSSRIRSWGSPSTRWFPLQTAERKHWTRIDASVSVASHWTVPFSTVLWSTYCGQRWAVSQSLVRNQWPKTAHSPDDTHGDDDEENESTSDGHHGVHPNGILLWEGKISPLGSTTSRWWSLPSPG